MTLRRGLKAYFTGWMNFLASIVYVILWYIIIGLPFGLLGLLMPGRPEGDASGITIVHVLWAVVLLSWIPWISYKLGMLAFESDARPAKPRRKTDPDIELLRGIIATQDRLSAQDGEPEEEDQASAEGG